jgi:hypothetical protein
MTAKQDFPLFNTSTTIKTGTLTNVKKKTQPIAGVLRYGEICVGISRLGFRKKFYLS